MVKIVLDRSKCIGCGSCAAVCPLYFEMVEDGKSQLKNSQKSTDEIETIEVTDVGCAKDASDVCPVQVIKVE